MCGRFEVNLSAKFRMGFYVPESPRRCLLGQAGLIESQLRNTNDEGWAKTRLPDA